MLGSVLSKRWIFLYTQIPQLTLSPILLVTTISPHPDPLSVAKVEKIISNLLLLHSPDIEAFHLFNHPLQFTCESVWQWVRYTTSRNVQHLTLCELPRHYCNFRLYTRGGREIPPALFSCTHLATLRLSNYNLTHLPSHFSGFNHLITCSFEGMEFTDDILSCFISHTPFLQKLTLNACIGLRKPVISAADLTHLYVEGISWKALTVNCPKVRTLEIIALTGNIGDLRINGVLFHELSCLVSKIKMQCGSNVAVLWLASGYVSVERVVEIVGNFKTLKKLVIYDLWKSQTQRVVFVDNMLKRLPGLTRLRVRGMYELELVRDPMLPCVISLLDNIRRVKVCINRFVKGEIRMLDKLLKSASALEILEVELPSLSEGQSRVGTSSSEEWKANTFLQKLLDLKSGSASTGARICVTF